MVQHRAARFVLGKPWRRCERDSITNMLNQLNWTTLEKRRKYARLTLLYKILHKLICIPESYLPHYLHQKLGAIMNLNFYTTRQMLTATNMHIFQELYLTGIISLRT